MNLRITRARALGADDELERTTAQTMKLQAPGGLKGSGILEDVLRLKVAACYQTLPNKMVRLTPAVGLDARV